MDGPIELTQTLCAKCDRLLRLLESYGSCAIAFSGGLDSAVLAKAARLALENRAVAVTGVSASLAAGELDEAKNLAQQIGIRHEIIQTDELANPEYRKNQADRCYHCKTDLFARIDELAKRLDLAVVADGSNADDRKDHRPGMRAARERNVRSPLAECALSKAEIRQLAAHWGIAIWNKPATPCLGSRIAYGEEVTPERLAMIEQAERFLRDQGFQPLRVRYHKGDMARIELSPDALSRLLEPALRQQLIDTLKSLGFKYVSLDLEGFRSGSLNAVVPLEQLTLGGHGE